MNDKVHALINQAAVGWVYLEALDELEGTDAYQKEVKQKVKLLMPVLEKALNEEMGKVWGRNGTEADRTFYKIIDGWKAIASKLADLPNEYVPPMAELITLMLKDPEKMMAVANKYWDSDPVSNLESDLTSSDNFENGEKTYQKDKALETNVI